MTRTYRHKRLKRDQPVAKKKDITAKFHYRLPGGTDDVDGPKSINNVGAK